MIWLLAGAAFSAVQAISGAQMQRATDKANNKAIEAYNKQVALQAAKSFSEISVQKAVAAQQTTAALYAVNRQGNELKAQRGLQAAASDTLGASVDQALLDADRQVDEASNTLMYNANITDQQLNAQAQSVADSAGFSLKAKTPVTNVWGSALGQVVGQFGSMLLSNKINTGSFTGRNQGA